MGVPDRQIMSLLGEAVEHRSPPERAAFLDRACAGDAGLRARVEELLRAYEAAGNFLQGDRPDPDRIETAAEPMPERPGAVLGPYKLLEQLGEGGFGVVFLAEQAQPVRRKVALKVLKAGMDSRQVVARFEAERQALAIMDHPHIAKVLDGGATPAGRPYFVMELVKGVPITAFCDQNHLTARQRLGLFVSVCEAVQHAHQKGIIHRDLKPSNVLVSRHDATPVVKVIDFGVAKALGQQLTDKTLYTAVAQLVGTPLYMSPEQAGMSDLDVDTRSDIYSLGVLLYELLTGTTPFTRERFQSAGYDEIRRILREEESPRPSTRLSTLGQDAATVSANGGNDSRALSRLLRGELDWIVMKALEKDRSRRYETANAFALDVQRYLADEPVLACPPSAWYRFRKFARRNKRALGTSALLGLVLLAACAAVAATLGWTMRDREVRRAATAARFDQILQESERLYREGRLPEATAAAKKAQELVEPGGEGEKSRRRLGEWLADLDMVARLEYARGRRQEPLYDFRALQASLAEAFRAYGIDVDALPPAEAAARVAARPVRVDLAVALDVWAWHDRARAQRLRAVAAAADPDPVRTRLRDAAARANLPALVKLAETLDVEKVPVPVLDLLGQRLWDAGDQRASIAFLRRVQNRHPGDYCINLALGHALFRASKDWSLDDAIRYYAAAIAVRPDSGVAHYYLGRSLFLKGRRDESLAVYRRLVAIDPWYPGGHRNLSNLLAMKGQTDEAIAVLRAAPLSKGEEAAISQQLARLLSDRAWQLATHPNPQAQDPPGAVALAGEAVGRQPATGAYWQTLGVAQYRAGNWQGAIHALQKWGELQPPGHGAGEFFLAMAYGQLGNRKEAGARYDRAARWMDQVGPQDPALRRFRAEADQVLGLTKAK